MDSQLLAGWVGTTRVPTRCLQEIRLNFHEERAIKTDFPLWGGFVGSLNGQVSFAKEPRKNRAFAKETCEFREPTNRCHLIPSTDQFPLKFPLKLRLISPYISP